MGLIKTKRGQSQRDCVFQPRVSEPWVNGLAPGISTLNGLRTQGQQLGYVRNPYRVDGQGVDSRTQGSETLG